MQYIKFNENKPYTVADNGNRVVEYADKHEIIDGIVEKYYPEWLEKDETSPKDSAAGNQNQVESRKPKQSSPKKPAGKKKGGSQEVALKTVPRANWQQKNISKLSEVRQNGQT